MAAASEAGLYAETVVRGFFGRDEVNAEERNLGRILAAMPGTLTAVKKQPFQPLPEKL